MKKLIALTTTLLALGNCFATDYYLDATNGNNDWTGTSPDIPPIGCTTNCIGPWKTMDAIELFSDPSPDIGFEAGDRILFKKGETFLATTSLQFEDSGHGNKPIIFSSYGEGEKPILVMGGYPIPPLSWADLGDGRWKYSYTSTAVAGFWEDGIHLKHASNENLADGDFYWKQGDGIYYRPYDDDARNHTTYKTGTAYGIAINNLKYLEFNDLHFKIGPHAIGGTAIDSPIRNILIENCQFDNMTGPIYIMSRNGNNNRNIAIINNTFNSQRRAITIQAQGNGIEQNYNINIKGNIITDLDTNDHYVSFLDDVGQSTDNEAISGQNFMNSSVTDNAINDGSDGIGISMWTNSESTFNNNIFARNVISNIAVGITLFSSNTYNSHVGNRIYQNIIHDCTHHDGMAAVGAIRLSGDDSPGSNLVYNNTIANCGTSFYLFPSEGFTIINNLSMNPIDRHIWYLGNILTDKTPILDNNLYYTSSDSGLPSFEAGFKHGNLEAGPEITFNEWQSLTNVDEVSLNLDSNSLIEDPLVVNLTGDANGENKDFHLESESPAIDAGANLGTRIDFDGNRIKRFPDIGAYEYY